MSEEVKEEKFSDLEKLGFILHDYLMAKFPPSQGQFEYKARDEVFGDFEFRAVTRNGKTKYFIKPLGDRKKFKPVKENRERATRDEKPAEPVKENRRNGQKRRYYKGSEDKGFKAPVEEKKVEESTTTQPETPNQA